MGRAIIVSQIYCVAIFFKQNKEKKKAKYKKKQPKNLKNRKEEKLKTKKYQTKIKWTGTKTRNSNDPHFYSLYCSNDCALCCDWLKIY